MKLTLLITILAVLTAGAAFAATQAINIESGDTITVTSQAGFHLGKVSELAVTYTISDLGFYHQVVEKDPKDDTITQDLHIDAPQGTYILTTKLYVNSKLSKTEELFVTVLPDGTLGSPNQPSQPNTGTPNNPANPATPTPIPVGPRPTITIPRIPDVEAGSSFVVPVTIQGKGTYELTIPRLEFGTYDIPPYVIVDGENTVGVLLHIDEYATPGIYTLTIGAGGEQATTRIRIIQYHQENFWWLLIPAGILLIILGILLFFQTKRQKPYEPVRPQKPQSGPNENTGDIITYY